MEFLHTRAVRRFKKYGGEWKTSNVRVICPPYWSRVNWSAKIWKGHDLLPYGPPHSDSYANHNLKLEQIPQRKMYNGFTDQRIGKKLGKSNYLYKHGVQSSFKFVSKKAMKNIISRRTVGFSLLFLDTDFYSTVWFWLNFYCSYRRQHW